MRKILQFILSIFAGLYIWRFRPMIIAVTGNVGKTSTKEAIAAVARRVKRVRVSGGNLNNELGVPLTILGDWADEYYRSGGGAWFWFKVLFWAKLGFFGLRSKYPEVLLLEFGADRPGDIARLARKFRPHIAVVTAIGETPVHVEYFAGPAEIAREKSKIVEVLGPRDFAVLNHDDLSVLDMREKTKAAVFTFGFTEGAVVKVSDFDLRSDADSGLPRDEILRGRPLGVTFKLHYRDQSFVPVRLNGCLGKSQAMAAAAAGCVGSILGMNLIEISEALAGYHCPNGRLKILAGVKNTWIIDDTYNAAPASTHLALDTLKALSSKRKIAVLGDMLELGEYSEKTHRAIGDLAGSFVDVLVTVGARAKFIADSAANQLRRSPSEVGAPTEASGMVKENIFSFDVSDEAKIKVQELLEPGDIILIKGSQGMRMERVVEEIMAEPSRREELLVRQSHRWLAK